MTFEEIVLPHLDAAYNLARWLTGNDDDAQDLVQEAYLRAFRFYKGFRGTDGRPWVLTILRNTFYTWSKLNSTARSYEVDKALHVLESNQPDPETAYVLSSQRRQIAEAIEQLPSEFREVIILRELEELSYKEIAEITGVPIGTVMSRLARARHKLQISLVCSISTRGKDAIDEPNRNCSHNFDEQWRRGIFESDHFRE